MAWQVPQQHVNVAHLPRADTLELVETEAWELEPVAEVSRP